MTFATLEPRLLVEDLSSLKNLDFLVGISRSMMDLMVQSPASLGLFTEHAFNGVSSQFFVQGVGVKDTFDFSHHQAHPFSMSLVTRQGGEQEWSAKLSKTELLFKSLGDRTYNNQSFEWKAGQPLAPADGPWEIRAKGFQASLLPSLASYLQQVSQWSMGLAETLKSPVFLQAVRIEKSALKGLRFMAEPDEDFSSPSTRPRKVL